MLRVPEGSRPRLLTSRLGSRQTQGPRASWRTRSCEQAGECCSGMCLLTCTCTGLAARCSSDAAPLAVRDFSAKAEHAPAGVAQTATPASPTATVAAVAVRTSAVPSLAAIWPVRAAPIRMIVAPRSIAPSSSIGPAASRAGPARLAARPWARIAPVASPAARARPATAPVAFRRASEPRNFATMIVPAAPVVVVRAASVAPAPVPSSRVPPTPAAVGEPAPVASAPAHPRVLRAKQPGTVAMACVPTEPAAAGLTTSLARATKTAVQASSALEGSAGTMGAAIWLPPAWTILTAVSWAAATATAPPSAVWNASSPWTAPAALPAWIAGVERVDKEPKLATRPTTAVQDLPTKDPNWQTFDWPWACTSGCETENASCAGGMPCCAGLECNCCSNNCPTGTCT